MAGFNRVIIIGNLTRDPDYKSINANQAVCRLSLATNRQFKNRQTGALVQEVCYIDVDVWGPQAESSRQYLQKGRPVLIEGRLKYDTWDANGQTRGKHSIVADRVVFLGTSAPAEEVESDTALAARAPMSEQPEMSVAPATPLEKDLLDQIGKIKLRAQKNNSQSVPKKMSQEPISTGEIDFKDQPPFEDELPF